MRREPPAGFEPAQSRLEDGGPSIGRRGQRRAGRGSNSAPRTCKPRSSPEIRLVTGASGPGAVEENRTPVASSARLHSTFELPPQKTHVLDRGRGPGAMEENRTPVASVACLHSTFELPSQETEGPLGAPVRSEQRESNPHRRLGRPRPCRWTMLAEDPLSCSRELHSPSPVYQTGAPLTGPEQRYGGIGRDRTGYLLTASQALSRLSYDPRRWGGPAFPRGRPECGRRTPIRPGDEASVGQAELVGVSVDEAGNPRATARPGGATGNRTPIPTVRG